MQQHQKLQPIEEFNQYDGKFPILNPDYKDKEYLKSFEQLKTLIKNQEYSQRANKLANVVVDKLPSNYNAWYIKRKCLQYGSAILTQQKTFTQIFLKENIKNFQGWQYRRHLLQILKDPAGQLDFIEKVLEEDNKNYHVWSYRIWLTRHYKLYEQELTRILKWIDQDIMNNSAWAYRRFLLDSKKLSQQDFKLQFEYVIDKLKLNYQNEAVWNYLRGWFPSIKLRGIPSQNHLQRSVSFPDFPELFDMLMTLMQPANIHAYISLVHVYSQDPAQIQLAKGVCQVLINLQPQRKNYWQWVLQHL